MLEFADIRFNDSIGKIAHSLYRLSHTTSSAHEEYLNERTINFSFTHEELATRINSNRTTITKGLNKLRDDGIIRFDGKHITIINNEKLKQAFNQYIFKD